MVVTLLYNTQKHLVSRVCEKFYNYLEFQSMDKVQKPGNPECLQLFTISCVSYWHHFPHRYLLEIKLTKPLSVTGSEFYRILRLQSVNIF
jgi:hypothetical protein